MPLSLLLHEYKDSTAEQTIKTWLDENTGHIYTIIKRPNYPYNDAKEKQCLLTNTTLQQSKSKLPQGLILISHFQTQDEMKHTIEKALKPYQDIIEEINAIVLDENNLKTFNYFLQNGREISDINNQIKFLVSSVKNTLLNINFHNSKLNNIFLNLKNPPKLPLINTMPIYIKNNNFTNSNYIKFLEDGNINLIKDYINHITFYYTSLKNINSAFEALKQSCTEFSNECNTLINQPELDASSEWRTLLPFMLNNKINSLNSLIADFTQNFSNFNDKFNGFLAPYLSYNNQCILINDNNIATSKSCLQFITELDRLKLSAQNKTQDNLDNIKKSTLLIEENLKKTKKIINPALYEFIENKIHNNLHDLDNNIGLLTPKVFTNPPLFLSPKEKDTVENSSFFKKNLKTLLIGASIGFLVGLTLALLVFVPYVAPALGLTYLASELTIAGLIIVGSSIGAITGCFLGVLTKYLFCAKKNKIYNSSDVMKDSLQEPFPGKSLHHQISNLKLQIPTSTALIHGSTGITKRVTFDEKSLSSNPNPTKQFSSNMYTTPTLSPVHNSDTLQPNTYLNRP